MTHHQNNMNDFDFLGAQQMLLGRLDEIVEVHYCNLFKNKRIASQFDGLDMTRQKTALGNMLRFCCSTTQVPPLARSSMYQAVRLWHQDRGITPDDYGFFMRCLLDATNKVLCPGFTHHPYERIWTQMFESILSEITN